MKTLEYYLGLPYRMEIIPDISEGGYAVCFPELPGRLTCGDTLAQASANAEECKQEWLSAAFKDWYPIPGPLTNNGQHTANQANAYFIVK